MVKGLTVCSGMGWKLVCVKNCGTRESRLGFNWSLVYMWSSCYTGSVSCNGGEHRGNFSPKCSNPPPPLGP